MPQSDLLRLCAVEAVSEGAPFQVKIAGYPAFAVYFVEGEFYVTDDACTHGAASLCDEGDLNGFHIECGWHFGVFDIRTGEVVSRPATCPLKSYPVTVQEGEVYIRLV
ncbi:MAG: non-heme iron oxygenase ferredoxin subunit [Alphaproteobacteria bacterium]